MGSLQYDRIIAQFDDQVLSHLQIVIVQKLRHGESFLMSWPDSMEVGDGRSAIWLNPTQQLYFKFLGGRAPAINPEWLEHLTESANSSRGLIVTDEPNPARQGQPVQVAESQTVQRSFGPSYTKAD